MKVIIGAQVRVSGNGGLNKLLMSIVKMSGMKHLRNNAVFILVVLVSFTSCRKDPPVKTVNNPPFASAGVDQTLSLPLDSAELSGTGGDPEGGILTYSWNKLSGPSSTIVNADKALAKIKNLVPGIYIFEFKVTDDGGLTAKDTLIISVIDVVTVNQAPVASAGPGIHLVLPVDSTELQGSATDPDGVIISYRWTKISGPSSFTIVNPDDPLTKIKNLAQGIYEFELKVTDNGGENGKDTVTITVNAAPPTNQPPVVQPPITDPHVNQPPVAVAGANQSLILPRDSTMLDGSGFDQDGHVVAYRWSKVSGPAAYVIEHPNNASTKIKNLVQGFYVFELTVTDNGGLFGTDTIVVVVSADDPCYGCWDY